MFRLLCRQVREGQNVEMLYILYCTDDPVVSTTIRSLHVQEHLAYLEEHKHIVVLGGARLQEDGATRIGSTLILNVERREQACEFSRNEPFYKAGLYARVEIQRMRRGQWYPDNAPTTADGN